MASAQLYYISQLHATTQVSVYLLAYLSRIFRKSASAKLLHLRKDSEDMAMLWDALGASPKPVQPICELE
jgi:hypothetical protein